MIQDLPGAGTNFQGEAPTYYSASLLLPSANKVWGKVMLGWGPASRGSANRGALHPRRSASGGGGRSASTGQGVLHIPSPHQILWDTVNERAVRILLECILVEDCMKK